MSCSTGPAAPVLSSLTVIKRSGKVVNQVIAGMKGKKLQLIADGTGFDSGAQLLVNGAQLSLVSSSATEIIGAFTNATVASPGTLTIEVMNSSGKASNTLTLTIVASDQPSLIQSRRTGSGTVRRR